MNLSDHSESIHKNIQELKELSGELQQNQALHPFSLFSWLGGFSFGPLVKHVVAIAIMGLVVLLMLTLGLPCIFSYIQWFINVKQVMLMHTHTVMALQWLINKKGGT